MEKIHHGYGSCSVDFAFPLSPGHYYGQMSDTTNDEDSYLVNDDNDKPESMLFWPMEEIHHGYGSCSVAFAFPLPSGHYLAFDNYFSMSAPSSLLS